MLALMFGLATGIGEVILRMMLKLALGHMMRVPLQFVWMAPVSNAVLFAFAGLILWMVGLATRRLRDERVILAAFSTLTFSAWLLLVPRLDSWAALVLGLGLGWQGSALLVRRTRQRVIVIARLAAIVVIATIAVNLGLWIRERTVLARLADSPDGAPNVLFIIWDTVRAKSLSLYGSSRRTTPHLAALADRGVTFTRAISTSPWTLPSHASMFTGRLPHETSVAWYSPLDAEFPTVAEQLQKNGWVTGAFAANVLYVDFEHGLARGFAHFEDFRVTPGQVMIASSLGGRILTGGGGWTPGFLRTLLGHNHKFIGRKWADHVNSDFLAWLDERDENRPFFAFLNLFDAHLPYDPPAPFDTLFGPRRRETTLGERFDRLMEARDKWDMNPDDLAAEQRMYDASIAYLDDRLRMLLDSLASRDILDNTLIIVSSDHGESFGEHGDFEHGSNLYFEQTHVPLVLSLPGRIPVGLVIDEPVSTREIAATIDAVATDREVPELPGPTLTRFWTDQPFEAPGAAISELVPGREPDRRMTSIFVDGLKYIVNTDDRLELYDAERDWAETTDLISTAGAEALLQRVRAATDIATSCGSLQCCCPLPPNAFPSLHGAERSRRSPARQ